MVTDAGVSSLTPVGQDLVALTDLLIGLPQPPDASLVSRLRSEFTDAQLAELVMGVGLFLGMSKVLITLGLEPEVMETTVVSTPGSNTE